MLLLRLLRSAVLLLCLVALTGCHDDHASDDHGLVPWTDHAVGTAQLAESATVPTCQVAALRLPRAEQRWGGVWNDAAAGYLVVENTGRRPCDLPVPTRVAASTPAGGPVTFDVGRLSAANLTLDPGGRAQVQVGSPYDCGKQLVRSTGFQFTFPTGTLRVPEARMAVQCGGSLVDFSARGSGSPGTAAVSLPAARLEVRVSQVPATIVPDRPVSYAVTLFNPTATTIDLDPCPTYQEGIKGRPATLATYQLNCDTVHQIEPHASATFAMKLYLPPSLSSGSAVLDWRLQVPPQDLGQGQFASADTQVR